MFGLGMRSGTVAAANLVTPATGAPPSIYGTARRGPTSLSLGWALPIRARVKDPVGRWTNWWRSTQHHLLCIFPAWSKLFDIKSILSFTRLWFKKPNWNPFAVLVFPFQVYSDSILFSLTYLIKCPANLVFTYCELLIYLVINLYSASVFRRISFSPFQFIVISGWVLRLYCLVNQNDKHLTIKLLPPFMSEVCYSL